MINQISRFFLHEYQVNNEGGKIFVDRKVANWLDSFSTENTNQKSSSEIKIYKQITKCGFDENPNISPPEKYPKISIVLVLYNSKFWVENLSKMFENLSPWLHEIVVVDNGSNDDGLVLLKERISRITCIKNKSSKSFAAAINQGTRNSTGEVFLIINPDVYIPRNSLWALIDCYLKNPTVGAISPKLLLMRTPGFINGIGNIVKPFWHGYDLGLGHLDIGQFDEIVELPSACFAAILIPRNSWERVGELDEEYPMYYEDSDWCYRARNQGMKIRFCHHSKIYHRFQSSATINEKRIYNRKQFSHITYGRIRYIVKNLNYLEARYFLLFGLLYDIFYIIKYYFLFHELLLKDLLYIWKENHLKFLSFRKPPFHKSFNQPKSYFSAYPRIYEGIPVLNRNILIKILKEKESNLRN